MAVLGSEHTARFHQWSYVVYADETAVVLPDGCMDILLISNGEHEQPQVLATDWDFAPRRVALGAGTTVLGFRLRPGTQVSAELKRDMLLGSNGNLRRAIEDIIAAHTRCDEEVAEIIDVLSRKDDPITRVARQQGVSERTLQRHFKNLALPRPGFWRQLGRARRTARELQSDRALGELAAGFGYSDQPHMTREFVRWFGLTPKQLRGDLETAHILAQPGLGNW